MEFDKEMDLLIKYFKDRNINPVHAVGLMHATVCVMQADWASISGTLKKN